MASFELGNYQTIEELTLKKYTSGRFVFRREDSLFRLFLGEFDSHPALVRALKLVKNGEAEYGAIWGGGNFEVSSRTLRFSGASGNYGQVPNSFLIDCCRHVTIPHIESYIFTLAPYSPHDSQLNERRRTWRELGNYELDTERKEYIFDKDMNLIEVK